MPCILEVLYLLDDPKKYKNTVIWGIEMGIKGLERDGWVIKNT